jgi:hypothetical protein
MTTAITTTSFIDSLGVNTHIDFNAYGYQNLSTVAAAINYLGLKNIRDSAQNASDASAWQQAAQATGAKFDDYIGETSPAGMLADLGYVAQLAQEGVLNFVEGGNEEDDAYPASLGNTLGITAQFQQQVHAIAQQYGLPAINMSFGSGWTAANDWHGDYDKVGNLSAFANYANAHTYPNPGQTPDSSIQQLNSDALLAAPGDPVITTEIGWNGSTFSQSQTAQYVVDAALDGIKDGDARMYYYALFNDSSGNFGLMNSDGSATPAGTALHDLTTLLADHGGGFTPGLYNYSLSDQDSTGNSLLMQKSDGSDWIALWDESAGTHTVMVNLPSVASKIEVYDPVTGTSAIASASNASSIQVSLGADPLLVEVVPGGSSAATGSTSTGSGTTTTSTSGGSTTTSTSTGSDPSTSTSTSSIPGSNDLSVAVPASETVSAGATRAISGVTASDAWAAASGGTMALNVWDQSGTLSIDGKTFGPGGGVVSGGMVSGTLAQINADLATLSYTAGSKAGSDTITVDVWNQAGVQAKETIPVTVTGGAASDPSSGSGSAGGAGTSSTNTSGGTGAAGTSNDLAVAVPGSESVAAGAMQAISGVSVSDPWAAGTGGDMALNVWDQSGTLSIDGQTFGPGGGPVPFGMFSGSLAQINADLASLTYTAGAKGGSDTITVDVWNQAGVEVKETIGVNSAGSGGSATTTSSSGSSGASDGSSSRGISIASDDAAPVENVSNAVISATAGDHMIFIGGTGNTLTATGGTETVKAFQGGNTITTGEGNDKIYYAGSGNVIDAGGGTNTLYDSGSNNTIVLPGADQGTDNIYGYMMSNGDKLDLRGLLGSTSWDGAANTLGNYLSVSQSGNNAVIHVDPSGVSGGASYVAATLEEAGAVSLSTLLSHSMT